MATNTKPQLIVLIDETKREQLKALALDNNKSMGWVVNQLIDRLLSGETVLDMPVEITKSLGAIDIAKTIEPIEGRLADIEQRLADIEVIENRLTDIEGRLADTAKPDKPVTGDSSLSQIDKGYKTWVEFHKYIGEPKPDKRNVANGNKAIGVAKDKGLGDWLFNSDYDKFTKA